MRIFPISSREEMHQLIELRVVRIRSLWEVRLPGRESMRDIRELENLDRIPEETQSRDKPPEQRKRGYS